MKNPILTILLLAPILCLSQFTTPEVFVEAGIFYEDEFEEKPRAYAKFNAGLELFSYKFFAPEVDVAIYTGNDNRESSNFDITIGEVTDAYQLGRKFNSTIWGFAPKFFLDTDEVRWVVIPKYNFGNVFAEGNYWDIDDLEISQKVKAIIYFWSFAFGLESFAEEKNTRYALYLWYSGFNAGKALNQLDFESVGFSKQNYNTRTLGISFRLYYNFKRKHNMPAD